MARLASRAALIAGSPSLARVTDFGLGSDGVSGGEARAIVAARFWPGLGFETTAYRLFRSITPTPR